MIKIVKVKDAGIWKIWNDGWFEFYYCSKCHANLWLITEKKPLPDKCPNCGHLMAVDNKPLDE